MGHIFSDEDRFKSNINSVEQSIKKYFKKGTHPPSRWLRKILCEHFKVKYKCSICSISQWNDNDIILEVDHINGDHSDNRIKNLRFLCPNCHSQTSTFKGKNINSGFTKVTDSELIEAFNSEGNIRKALIKVGLSPRGANYSRMYKVLSYKEN